MAKETPKERKPCNSGKAWIQKQLEKDGMIGDKGAEERWTGEWFKRQEKYVAMRKHKRNNPQVSASR